ncbi:cytochrome D ubiquinol oxidase subunit II (plasmid) [Borreliella chilensis]|uniref:Cytochrome D ubiquinol oxidase subunit II n=1 Tax=Borreliella chilensis TaxID=1245910 RepID=A0A0A7UWR5_9SPIR|nr:cytochrome D ubiquinol oxidase subunit II [Borreliella chilensis]
MIKFNLITALFVALLAACNSGLTGEAKIKLESSARDVKNEILKIKKEATGKGVNFEAFTDSATGSKVSNGRTVLREAKVQAISAIKKFLKTIEEESVKLKESGSNGQFLAMFDLMLETVGSLEAVGIKGVKGNVSEKAKNNPVDTAERVMEVKVQIENKLEEVRRKQGLDDGDKKEKKQKHK